MYIYDVCIYIYKNIYIIHNLLLRFICLLCTIMGGENDLSNTCLPYFMCLILG